MKTISQIKEDVAVKNLSKVQLDKERPVGWTFSDELSWQWVSKDTNLYKKDAWVKKQPYSLANTLTTLWEVYDSLANTLELLDKTFGVKAERVDMMWKITYHKKDMTYEIGTFNDLAEGLKFAFSTITD